MPMVGHQSMRAVLCLCILSAILAQPGPSPGGSGNRINKHTYSSNDGVGDYNFISTYFCDADTSSADYKCAVDMKASCSGFDVHMVQSFVTKNGTETPNEWWSYLHDLHGNMTEWDQFMHYGTTFLTSDLSAHLERFQADGIPFFARKTSSGSTYSLLVQTPSAKVMEIVAASAPSKGANLFKNWEQHECPAAHSWDEEQLNTILSSQELQGRSSGLPSLTAIGVNIAASADSVSGIGSWLKKYNIAGSSGSAEPSVTKDGNCTVSSTIFANGQVRYVSNPSARVGARSVEDYEKYQMSTHRQYVGQGTGWDAFMDNHWCVGVSHSVYLDSIAKLWAADNVSWHAHKTPRVSSVRSVGFRGESIELNGVVDGSFLKHLQGFDFCTASTDPKH